MVAITYTKLDYWGERERVPTLLMSMEIVYVRTCVRTYVRPRPTATLCMRERCSNSADLAGFGAICFWSRKCHGGVRVVK